MDIDQFISFNRHEFHEWFKNLGRAATVVCPEEVSSEKGWLGWSKERLLNETLEALDAVAAERDRLVSQVTDLTECLWESVNARWNEVRNPSRAAQERCTEAERSARAVLARLSLTEEPPTDD